MGKILISLIIVFSLIIQKFESNISNEKLILKVQNWHLQVKNHMELIIYSPYESISKKILIKWFSIVFMLFAMINCISINIFGNDSINSFLNNKIILYLSLFIMIILTGLLSDKKTMYILRFLLILSAGNTAYFLFTSYSTTSIYAQLLMGFALVIGIILCFFLFSITDYILKKVAYLFYLFLKCFFRLCIYLNPQKPLKPLVTLTEISAILLISIMTLVY